MTVSNALSSRSASSRPPAFPDGHLRRARGDAPHPRGLLALAGRCRPRGLRRADRARCLAPAARDLRRYRCAAGRQSLDPHRVRVTPMPEVVIVPTGTANLASVHGGVPSAGRGAAGGGEPARIAGASHVMLPGVGAFGASMARLEERGLDGVLRDRSPPTGRPSHLRRPPAAVRDQRGEPRRARAWASSPAMSAAFPTSVRVPQFGWNLVQAGEALRPARGGLRLLRQQLPGHRRPGLEGGASRAWRPLRRRDGAGQRDRLPVPPRAVGRLRRGLLSRFLGS